MLFESYWISSLEGAKPGPTKEAGRGWKSSGRSLDGGRQGKSSRHPKELFGASEIFNGGPGGDIRGRHAQVGPKPEWDSQYVDPD